MERFLDFQKPIYRMDVFVALEGRHRSSEIGPQGILLKIDGLQDLGKSSYLLMWNQIGHRNSDSHLVTQAHLWLGEKKDEFISCIPSIGPSLSMMTAYCELSLTTGGHRVRIADLSTISLSAFITDGLCPSVRRLTIDANGYELFNCPAATTVEESSLELPVIPGVSVNDVKWFQAVNDVGHELTFSPPAPSGRLLPLRRLGH